MFMSVSLDLIRERSRWAFFEKKQKEFLEHFFNIVQTWEQAEKILKYMKKRTEKQLELAKPYQEEIPSTFLDEFVTTLDNVTSSYDILLDLFKLNEEPIAELMEKQQELLDHFASYKCPEDKPGCYDKEKIHAFYDDMGLVCPCFRIHSRIFKKVVFGIRLILMKYIHLDWISSRLRHIIPKWQL